MSTLKQRIRGAVAGRLVRRRRQDEIDVIEGRNGTLFIHRGAHKLDEQARGHHPLDDAALRAFRDNLAWRRELCDALGIAFAHILSPDKQVILAEDHPLGDVYSIGSELRARIDEPFIFPNPYLDRTDFYVTDSHWNVRGHLKVAQDVLTAFGLGHHAPTVATWQNDIVTRKFTGDLGIKMRPPRSEMAPFLPPNHSVTRYTNGMEKHGSEGIVTVTANTAPLERKTLLIQGTSSTAAMLPTLSRIFEVVVHCRSRWVHPELVHMVRPDCLLTQNQEKYVRATKSDRNALPFLMYPDALDRPTDYTDKTLQVIAAVFSHGSIRHDRMLRQLRNGRAPGRLL